MGYKHYSTITFPAICATFLLYWTSLKSTIGKSCRGPKMPDKLAKIAEALYDSGCLKFGSFRIKSGALSPYYIDLACLLSSPKNLCTLTDVAVEKIRHLASTNRIDKLATIELKGALILPGIGCQTNIPCIIVRKEEKAYGATGRIAGAEIAKDDQVLFFDDVISEGLSKLEAIKPLEALGAKVENILVVVDREQQGKENLGKLGYKVHALARITELAQNLLQNRKIAEEQASAVLNYVRSG
jgi:orotate phosphoribosyltransferase